MVVVDVKHLATTAFDHPEAPKLRYRINDMSQSFFCLFVCFWHLKKKMYTQAEKIPFTHRLPRGAGDLSLFKNAKSVTTQFASISISLHVFL